MYIKALPKEQFYKLLLNKNINDDNVEKYKSTYFISVNEPNEQTYFKTQHHNVLTLHFHDCQHNINTYTNKNIVPFNTHMAKQIIDILLHAKHNKAKNIIIHCNAGISRSGAIATFARELFQQPNIQQFHIDNPYILPNQFVLHTLKHTLLQNYIQ